MTCNNGKNTLNKEWEEIVFEEGSADHLLSTSSKEGKKKVIIGSLLIKKKRMISSHGLSVKTNETKITPNSFFLNVLCSQITAAEATVKVK